MKKGKVPYSSLIRSVLRVPFERKETDHIARDGVFLGKGAIGSSTNTLVYGGIHAEALAFYRALNSALSAGIAPDTMQLSMLLPEHETEPVLKGRMQEFARLAAKENIRIVGGHTAFSVSVSLPVFTVVISGCCPEKTLVPAQDDALIMTKFAGDAGAEILHRELCTRLEKRFSPAFLDASDRGEEILSVRPETEALHDLPCVFHDVSEGGIFAALYELAEGYKCGFTVDMKRIPIHQETVEICEDLDLNPYTLFGTGSLLIVTSSAEEALDRLSAAGIPAVQIGKITAGKQKILLRGDEERFMERPDRDAVYILENFG